MFPLMSGSEGSKGFPATRCFAPGNQGSPGRPLLYKGGSRVTYSFQELGGITFFTPPVANLNDTMVDPRCKVLYMQH